MSIKRRLIGSVVLVAVVALGVGGWWWRSAAEEQATVVQGLPPIPDLTPASPEAREAIHAADARAHSVMSARRGLEELSRVYHANGFLEAATRCYEALEPLDPTEPRWLHRHATILAGYGDIEPAIALWQRVVQLAPDYEPARIRLADALLKSNRVSEAAATYEEVLRRNPQSGYGMLGLARIDFEAQRWDSARTRLEALVVQTKFELGYDLIVSLYERLGEHARAAAIRGAMKASGAYRDPKDPWMEELLDVCFDPYRLSVAAGTMSREAADKATELLQRAIDLAPQDVSNHYQLAMLAMQNRNLATARQELERCTTLAPEFSDGWAQLSGLQTQQGEDAAAARTLEEGLRHNPNSPGLHLMLARRLRQAGKLGEAIAEFKRSAELRPNEADAYLELGNLFIGQGRNEEGLEQIQLAVKAEPGNPMALSILAFNAIMQGDEPEARRWLARVQAQPRVRPEQLQALRVAYQKQFGRAP